MIPQLSGCGFRFIWVRCKGWKLRIWIFLLQYLLQNGGIREFRTLRRAFSVTFRDRKVTKRSHSISAGRQSPFPTSRQTKNYLTAPPKPRTINLRPPKRRKPRRLVCLPPSFSAKVLLSQYHGLYSATATGSHSYTCLSRVWVRTDQLEGEAAHGKRESQRKVEIAETGFGRI